MTKNQKKTIKELKQEVERLKLEKEKLELEKQIKELKKEEQVVPAGWVFDARCLYNTGDNIYFCRRYETKNK